MLPLLLLASCAFTNLVSVETGTRPGAPLYAPYSPHWSAQSSSRGASRATTIEALLTYPVFFHTREVVLRGEARARADATWLVSNDQQVQVTGRSATIGLDTSSSRVEIRGTFYDVGRLDPEDPRLVTFGLKELAERRLGRDRPGVGELLVVVAESSTSADPPVSPGVRAIALDPLRYHGQRVTVGGRFRGRNLYGDLPEAPGKSRWDFVLHSADAAIWITGRRPRGKGFNLDLNARVDTSQWLQVSGVVSHARGLVWIDAQEITPGQPPAPTAEAPVTPTPPNVGPPPEVIFSAPTADETDVARDVTIRVQFSRDMRADSFTGHVRVGYLTSQSIERGEPTAPAAEFTTRYDRGNRLLEIKFAQPLERFRSVRVELLEGIVATDGAPLKPWTLTFGLGG